jgi:hypothetical protein
VSRPFRLRRSNVAPATAGSAGPTANPIDDANQIKLLRDLKARSAGTELADGHRVWCRARLHQALDQRRAVADVLLSDDLGFAVDALALPQVEVRDATDEFLGQGSHVRSYAGRPIERKRQFGN